MPRTRYPTRFRGTRTVEIEIEIVEATFSAFDPGVVSGPLEMCYPPEGGELERLEARIGSLVIGEIGLRQMLGDAEFDALIDDIREAAEAEEPDEDELRDRRRDDELTGDR